MKTPEEIKKELYTLAYRFSGWLEGETAEDALAYINQLEEAVPRWISVKERLPNEKEGLVLVRVSGSKNGHIFLNNAYELAEYFPKDGMWVLWDYHPDEIQGMMVSDWCSLPKPPKEGQTYERP